MEVIKEGTHTYLLKQIEYRTPAYDESVVYAEKNELFLKRNVKKFCRI